MLTPCKNKLHRAEHVTCKQPGSESGGLWCFGSALGDGLPVLLPLVCARNEKCNCHSVATGNNRKHSNARPDLSQAILGRSIGQWQCRLENVVQCNGGQWTRRTCLFLSAAETLRCQTELTGWIDEWVAGWLGRWVIKYNPFFRQTISQEVVYHRSKVETVCAGTEYGWKLMPIAFILISGCRGCAEDLSDEGTLLVK